MARRLFRSAPSRPRAGIVPLGARELCATRLHNRSPAHPCPWPASPTPVLLPNPPASARALLAAAGAHESTSSNKLFFLIPETSARGTRQKISSSPGASTGLPALRTDIFPARQSEYPSPLPCAAPTLRSHRFS